MKKLTMILLVAICATFAANTATASGNEKLKGTWEYKAPAAPYEYRTGNLIIGEAAGKTTVAVKFTNGSEIKAKNVKVEKENISFEVEIEYQPVSFKGKLVDGKITGKVNSPEGLMDVTAQKKQ